MATRKKNRRISSKQLSESEKRAAVGRYERSGMSQVAFCREEGLNPWTLRDWRKRFSNRKSDLFVEVSEHKSESFEVEHQGFRIKVPAEFRPESLELLLKTLEGAKC